MNHFRINGIFVLLALSVSFTFVSPVEAEPPDFSWDRVPVFLHFGSNTRMTDEQVAKAAKLSNFICLEKAHGRSTDPTRPELVAAADAKRIKEINPQAKVLFYWNTLIAWPFTSYGRDFADRHPHNWILRDMNTGEPLLKTKLGEIPVYQYNLLNPEVRKWWADTAGGAVNDLGFDGIFMDAISQSKRPLWLRKGWGVGKEDELDAATIDMMQRLRAKIGQDGLLIYNGLHSTAGAKSRASGEEFLPYANGVMIEHFDQFSSTSKEDIVAFWKMTDEAAKAGKIVIYKAWPDHNINWLNREFMTKSAQEKESIARKKITFPLACYLIGARENSWFCYGWGYNIADGQLVEYPEYGRQLGPPMGNATRDGWVFRRQFQYAKVMVDLENREATIQWLGK